MARPTPRALRLLALGVALAFLAPALTGCLGLVPARIPQSVLDANPGWRTDPAHSQSEAQGNAMTRQQALAYKDEANGGNGYAASLTVITVRALVNPDEEALLEQVQALVKDAAENRGIRVDEEAAKGTRALATGATGRFFVYNGTVTQDDENGLFSRNAKTKILGEVSRCREERTSVVVVGLAQVTDTRSLGGVPFPTDHDPTTWHEIVADPAGTLEGVKGDGLAHGITCSG